MASPPHYTATPATPSTSISPPPFPVSLISPLLLNLAPLPDAVSFQTGLLGVGTDANVEGDVQIKHAGSGGDQDGENERLNYDKLEVVLVGVERRQVSRRRKVQGPAARRLEESDEDDDGPPPSISPPTFRSDAIAVQEGPQEVEEEVIELFNLRQTLWVASADADSTPPPSSRFKLPLTPDLPHCVHLPTSSLTYTLSTILSYASSRMDQPHPAPLVHSLPLHLTRTSPLHLADIPLPSLPLSSSSRSPTLQPLTKTLSDPLDIRLSLPRTVFRRSEPISLIVRLAVPSDSVVEDRGLRLRTVSAELIRKVRVVGEDSEAQQRVLARSGKSARFSSVRPIVIRLMLHPEAFGGEDGSCESITQSTIFHSVSFTLIATVSLFQTIASLSTAASTSTSGATMMTTRNDITISQEVFIVPDGPPRPTISTKSEKQRLVEGEAAQRNLHEDSDDPVDVTGLDVRSASALPTYNESALESSSSPSGSSLPPPPPFAFSPSSSAASHHPADLYSFGLDSDEEEYDGYETLSSEMAEANPPPAIDEDVSPPSASASSGEVPPGAETAPGKLDESSSSSSSSSTGISTPPLLPEHSAAVSTQVRSDATTAGAELEANAMTVPRELLFAAEGLSLEAPGVGGAEGERELLLPPPYAVPMSPATAGRVAELQVLEQGEEGAGRAHEHYHPRNGHAATGATGPPPYET